MEKYVCAISQCLLGDNVRYDGRSKANRFILEELSKTVSWLPICPEVEIGLGVPRPPIHLIRQLGEVKVVHVHDPTIDVTDTLQQHAISMAEKLKNVDGYILKARSPSCGLNSTAIEGESDVSNGIFVSAVKELLPELPMIDEELITVSEQRNAFFKAMQTYRNNR